MLDCEDTLARDRADAMAAALRLYGSRRQAAIMAERHGDRPAAEQYRAMARGALRPFPELLALVEGAATGAKVAAG